MVCVYTVIRNRHHHRAHRVKIELSFKWMSTVKQLQTSIFPPPAAVQYKAWNKQCGGISLCTTCLLWWSTWSVYSLVCSCPLVHMWAPAIVNDRCPIRMMAAVINLIRACLDLLSVKLTSAHPVTSIRSLRLTAVLPWHASSPMSAAVAT